MTAREEILAALPGLVARLGRDTFTPAEMVDELQRRGSRMAPATIRTHVVSRMCADAPAHHARVFDDFDRVGRGLYRRRQPS